MKYAHYDKETGKLLGYYDDAIHQTIPKPNIQILEKQWQEAVDNGYNYVDAENKILSYKDFRTLDEIKRQKLASLKAKFEIKLSKSTIHSQTINKDIDAGTVALTNINGLLDILENDDDTVEFRLADNSFTTVTRTQLVEMKKEIIQVGQQLYKNKWAIEEQINNETDIEKLKNSVIDLDNGMLVYTEPKGEE